MSNEFNHHPVPTRLTVPLTITLSGIGLEHLNAYREAVHALAFENWPDDAKVGNAPDKYRQHFEGRRDVAAVALSRIFSDVADEPPSCAAE